MRYILTFLIGLLSLSTFGQSEINLPVSAKQLSNQVWIDEDEVLWTGKEGKFIALGTKAYVDSLIGTIVTDGIEDIIAGSNIIIDKTDPKNPIISSTGGGEGSANWGEIGGTLSDQLDLWAELAAKAISGTGGSQVRNNTQLDARYLQGITDRLSAGTNVSFSGAGTPGSPLVINSTNTTYNGINGIGLSGTNFSPTYGTAANTVAEGNHTHPNLVPTSRTITINGIGYDLTENRSWTVSGAESTTNLALGTRTATTIPITNSNGTGFTIPAATDSLAGLMTAGAQTFLGKKEFLNGINISNSGDANGIWFAGSPNGLYRASGTRLVLKSTEELYLQGTNNGQGIGLYLTGGINAAALAGSGDRMVVAKSNGDLYTQAIPTGNPGTVTYVGMSLPTGFSVTDSPVTSSGTLTGSWASGYQAFTSAESSKLAGIAAGAQVNVATNLAQGTRTSTTVPITSSTGSSATLQEATTSLAGVMSSADKTKLDGIATGANNYTLPSMTNSVLGGGRLFSNTVQSVAANSVSSTADRTYGVQFNGSGQLVVNVPWEGGSQTLQQVMENGNSTDRLFVSTGNTSSISGVNRLELGYDNSTSTAVIGHRNSSNVSQSSMLLGATNVRFYLGGNLKLDITGTRNEFNGRVKGGDAINSDEFVTKSQLDAATGGGSGEETFFVSAASASGSKGIFRIDNGNTFYIEFVKGTSTLDAYVRSEYLDCGCYLFAKGTIEEGGYTTQYDYADYEQLNGGISTLSVPDPRLEFTGVVAYSDGVPIGSYKAEINTMNSGSDIPDGWLITVKTTSF